ncbi:hypothetical protein QFZ37_003205 [Chryseobacterium ginsenosidimutans]|uniref:hypothetical protein n=1 Tax=Chryseobacterium ginsenosidimutans TaxID=687846 RepID=UPI00277D568C|nr:hypothetical protein [Chryseobacterium ginsenosidimutans]MDQ0594836.1 hypothetical protein [Chryseobacterium ginsenosidimutans]
MKPLAAICICLQINKCKIALNIKRYKICKKCLLTVINLLFNFLFIMMEIKFYKHADKNLYCFIRDGKFETTISMEYIVDEKFWNLKDGEINKCDRYFYALQNFKKYLLQRSCELKTETKENVLNILKEEALNLLKNSGLEGVSKNIFNIYSNKFGLPQYDGYLLAFEKHTGFKQKDYRVEIFDSYLHIHTGKVIYKIDTYDGKTTFLKSILKKRSYFDIAMFTDYNIWLEIDEGEILKDKFCAVMHMEIEKYNGLEEDKDRLQRNFDLFTNKYKQSDVIGLAMAVDRDILYPIAVIVMTSIYDLDVCCLEYCELEFANRAWTAIFIDDELQEEDDNLPVFYIKSYP